MTDKNTIKDFYRNAISKRLQEIEEDETKENHNERGWLHVVSQENMAKLVLQ